jgi:hypothetical protein
VVSAAQRQLLDFLWQGRNICLQIESFSEDLDFPTNFLEKTLR